MSAEKEEMSIARKWRKVLVIGVIRVLLGEHMVE
jgi:hypothetical protein